jgi:26S proteasome regulatory subunit N1
LHLFLQTPEDIALKERLELAIERLTDPLIEIQYNALELIRKELREATSSMTSVPKPLKFLSPFYSQMIKIYDSIKDKVEYQKNKLLFADILSVLSLTKASPDSLSVLKYKLEGNTSSITDWGSEYIRSISSDIGVEYNNRINAENGPSSVSDLLEMVDLIVPYHMKHNAEIDAVDLLLEISNLSKLTSKDLYVDKISFSRVCIYLLKIADYLGDMEEAKNALTICFQLYLQQNDYLSALRIALKIIANNSEAFSDMDQHKSLISQVFDAAEGQLEMQIQLGFLLGRHRYFLYKSQHDAVNAAIGNQHLSHHFITLARDLDVLEPKTPEDIYKTHLIDDRSSKFDLQTKKLDNARENLASSYVNAFVNAGFGTDKLLSEEGSNSKWVFKHKDTGILAACASLGLINVWNESALSELDKFINSEDDLMRAGGLLGIGLLYSNVQNLDIDPVFTLLSEDLLPDSKSTRNVKLGAIFGLGIAYAGTSREDIAELLTALVSDTTPEGRDMELASIAGFSLGLVFVGSANEVHAAVIADRLLESTEIEAKQAIARHLGLGLGLLFLGKGELVNMMLEIIKTMDSPLGKALAVLLPACAYAGTGNVLQVQEMLRICAEHPEAEEKEAKAASAPAGLSTSESGSGTTSDTSDVSGKFLYQSIAVVGLALVAMGDDLSCSMATRMSDHLLQYGDTSVRRAVPLALSLIHISDADFTVVDTLSKLSHDLNPETAQAAIISMGIVGAGTNNSRIAGLLRQLTVFYKNEPDHMFVIRLAQAFVHMGKGLLSPNPFHSNRTLLSPVSVAGVLSTVMLFLDTKQMIHGKFHYLLFSFVISIFPRFATIVAAEDVTKTLHVDVRVGQAVETVGQAGKPKTITGFQTHKTPVLFTVKEKIELVDDTYIPLNSIIEGVVLVKQNPNATSTSTNNSGETKAS